MTYVLRYRLTGQTEFSEFTAGAIDAAHARKLLRQYVSSFGADPAKLEILSVSTPIPRRKQQCPQPQLT